MLTTHLQHRYFFKFKACSKEATEINHTLDSQFPTCFHARILDDDMRKLVCQGNRYEVMQLLEKAEHQMNIFMEGLLSPIVESA